MIIAFSGKKGVGKDTAVDALRGSYIVESESLARPMKEFVVSLGFEHDEVFGPSHMRERVSRNFGCSARHALQTLGTEWGRNMIHKDIWLKALISRLSPEIPHQDGWITVISDARFKNECDALRAVGARLIRIERPGLASVDSHPSEVELDNVPKDYWDAVIVNDGSLEWFKGAVRAAVAGLSIDQKWDKANDVLKGVA